MATKHRLSANIVRDSEKDLNYIPTPNGKLTVRQLVDDFRKGIRAFNIIGSYGTGKSSFLLALEQSIKKTKPYFESSLFDEVAYDSCKIVGSFTSIIGAFAEHLDLPNESNRVEHILSELYYRYQNVKGKNPLYFIIIDEFGKFLEYAAQNNPEQELYFVQQLAEFASNPDNQIALLTTVHQSFESYANGLGDTQRNEWIKVKGRFRELTFNEPVEQLLYLVSERLQEKAATAYDDALLKQLLKLFTASRAFNASDAYGKELYNRVQPLDLFAAYTLTLALQQYGQNERSLFSFLESTDHTSIEKFRKTESFYGLPQVYDYLNFNLHSFLHSKYNPHHLQWKAIRTALERVESVLSTNIEDYEKVIKSIGLLNIFSSAGAVLDRAFLERYLEVSQGIEHAPEILSSLEKAHIIRYRDYNKKFVLFEGSELDIELAIIQAGDHVDKSMATSALLKKYYDLPPVLAKQLSFKKGTPRYFEFVISEEPIGQTPQGEVDGFINLIFSDKIDEKKVQAASREQYDAVLYCYFKKSTQIKTLLYEIEKTLKVIGDNQEDKIARLELENIMLHQKNLLNHYILDSLYNSSKDVSWFHEGRKLKFDNKKAFNAQLSVICDTVYNAAPVFKNELVNKHKISNSVHTARKNYFRALVSSWNQPALGFESDRFPPEKMIYITLLQENGFTTNGDLQVMPESSFFALWNHSNSFLHLARTEKRSLKDFVEELQRRPFKLKQGFIDVWLATFLFLKRNDFALHNQNNLITELSFETLELVVRAPDEYRIKAFDVEGIRLDVFNSYRRFLNQETKETLNNQTFIETIKPFLSFYRSLSDYTKNTAQLSSEARAIRKILATTKDPEQAFFEDFPAALGTSLSQLQEDQGQFENYVVKLQAAIRDLRTSLDGLVDRFDAFIQSDIVYEQCSFEEYQQKLQRRFAKLKKPMLLQHQRTFAQCIDSPLDDKKAWLSSLAQTLVGRPLHNFRDEDEALLYDKFKTMILDLDSLTELSIADVDETEEEVLGFQINSFVTDIKHNLLRLPKKKSKEVDGIQQRLKTSLSKDKSLNIAALAKLLTEILEG